MTVPRGAWLAAGLLTLALAVVGGRYGFHRDELYFIEGGHHLAVGQPDNPMLVPLLATFWHWLVGGHLWAFRLLPAVVSGGTVLVAAYTSKALGGTARHQTWTAVAIALTSIVPGTGHLFSITTFDLLFTAASLLLLVRAVGQIRVGPWCTLGLVAGIALEVKVLLALVLLSCLVGILVVGPRAVLARRGPYVGAAIALVLAAPNLVWQAVHGWPMLDIAASISSGGSTSSASRSALVPLSLLMAGPLGAVVLVIGLVALFRLPALRPHAWLSIGYLVMLVLTLLTGGKPYYLAGFFPAVIAAGIVPVVDWVDRARSRKVAAVVLLAVFAIPTAFFVLPLAPPGSAVFKVATAVNPDGAETVGWPAYVETVRGVVRDLPRSTRRRTVILARNYGEAGALSRARRTSDRDRRLLPPVYSGHNAYWYWRRPPRSVRYVVLVGDFPRASLDDWFASCAPVATLESPKGVDNDEDGAPVRLCWGQRATWRVLWPSMQRLA